MWFITCVLFLMPIIPLHIADEVIESCVPNEETPEGNCIPILDCAVAVSMIKEKRKNPFRRCRFEGFTEIICCPLTHNKFGDDNTTATTGTGRSDGTRVADKECQKIKDIVNGILTLYIIGGEDVVAGEFPHMVALGYENGDSYTFDCGGSLVSESYVITAAHCAGNRLNKPPSVARIGTLDASDEHFNSVTDVRIAEVKLHPERTPATKYHDIALLRLESPIVINEVASPICLHTSDEDPKVPLTVTGWGQTTVSTRSKNITLQKASLTPLDRSVCGESYKISDQYWLKLPKGIIREQLCAHHPQGLMDTCQGDSGGPLQLLSKDNFYRLVGVTSFGIGCGTSKPGVYTKIYPYLDWIEKEVWPQ